MTRISTYFIIYLISCFIGSKAQNIDISIADKYSSDSLSSLMFNYSISPTWVNNESRAFYYSLEDYDGFSYYCFDLKKKRLIKIFTTYELTQKMAQLGVISSTLAPSPFKKHRLFKLDFDTKNLSYCDFEYKKQRFRYNIKQQELTKIQKKEKVNQSNKATITEWWKSYSADSLFYVTSYKHNLYLHNTLKKDSIQLTHDGEWYNSYALSGNSNRVKDSLLLSKPLGRWIKKSHCFFLVREDKRKIKTMAVVNSLSNPRPTLKTYKFPMPGDKDVAQYEAFMIHADKAIIHKIDIKKYLDQKIEVPRFAPIVHTDQYIYFIRRPRTNDKIDLCRLDIHSLELKTLIEEDCSPHLNEQLFNYHVINEGKEILWWSERDGKGAYFLYDGEGVLKNKITDKNCVAGHITSIDTLQRTFIFEGYGREKNINPYYKHFYKVDFKGQQTTLLTPGNGEHSITFSPDKKYIIDHYSRMDMAPIHELRDMKGNLVFRLGSCNLSHLYAKGWQEPQLLELTAADSITKLYGIVYMPFDLDSTKKYPIITNVYPGPHMDLIPKSFSLDDNYNQSLAQLGFIVINFGYRGSSPLRGKDFYNFGVDNLRDYPLKDDEAVIRQIANKYPFADISRIGIYGHSGGGFMTATAMLSKPDFYKVGVAASGNYDNNIYTQWWGETFHGVQQINDDKNKSTRFKCKIPTVAELAENLKGRLFLITGDVDVNVHPANTFRLANALIKANKRFDMMVIPGADHGLGDKYYINTIRYYFVENLLGTKLDHINIIKHN